MAVLADVNLNVIHTETQWKLKQILEFVINISLIQHIDTLIIQIVKYRS